MSAACLDRTRRTLWMPNDTCCILSRRPRAPWNCPRERSPSSLAPWWLSSPRVPTFAQLVRAEVARCRDRMRRTRSRTICTCCNPWCRRRRAPSNSMRWLSPRSSSSSSLSPPSELLSSSSPQPRVALSAHAACLDRTRRTRSTPIDICCILSSARARAPSNRPSRALRLWTFSPVADRFSPWVGAHGAFFVASKLLTASSPRSSRRRRAAIASPRRRARRPRRLAPP